MKNALSLIISGVLCFSTLLMLATQVKAEEIVWNVNPTPLPVPLVEHASVVYNGKIYVLGGSSIDGNRRNTVYIAEILPDETVGTWMTTTQLPEPREDFEAVAWNGFIYVLGGSTTGGAYLDTVLYAQIQPDGTLGDWLPTTSLPTTVAGYASAIWNGKIYVIIGGWPGWKGEVYYAQINLDGSIGNWNPTTSLPVPRRAPAAIIRNDVIYVIGGQYPSTVYHSTVYYANISPDGSVGTWSITTSFPTNIQNEEAVLVNDDIYIIGGDDGSAPFDTVIRPFVNPDSTIESWTQVQDNLPEPRTIHACVVSEGIIYVLGGWADGREDTIYYSSPLALPITATVDIDPDTLNLKSNGEWITAYIELPEEYSVSGIDVFSILLNGSISVDPEAPTEVGDYDADSISDLMVKFERAAVIEWLGTVDYGEDTGKTVEVTFAITGEVAGTRFEGVDTVRVLLQG